MKDLKTFLTEMAHAHKEKRTHMVMTPWGEFTGKEEEYEEYIVDKCDQQDWADFLRGKGELGPNLKNMKFYKIEKATEWHYNFGDSESKWKSDKFETLAIRWQEDDENKPWNIEMYAEEGSDLKLAKELFQDIEAYRTGKMKKDEFTGKWNVQYNDPKSKSEFPPLEMNITKSETGDEITIHMNAILS